ncbi:MAG: transposase [Ghiorsea sp.]|nr:transposase [Ghiorsea sp.]
MIDSTTINLCKQQFNWATFRSGKAGIKIHTVYDPNNKVPTFFSITTASKHDKRLLKRCLYWMVQPMFLIEPTTIMHGTIA